MNYTEIKVTKVEPLHSYKIKVVFNDNKETVIDLEPVLYGGLFGELRNPELFKSVTLNKEVQTIEWPNGADFHPETLYNWDRYKDAMHKAALKRKFKESA